MITKNEYQQAKSTVLKYEEQQKLDEEKLLSGDLILSDVLSTRAKNALIIRNNYYEQNPIRYLSEAVRMYKEEGSEYFFLRFKNIGKKTNEEIMNCIRPFL